MKEINRAKDMVDNYSTEEVLRWAERNLRNGLNAINVPKDSSQDSFLLGQCMVNIKEILDVIAALNEKLAPKSPVVA